MDRLAALIDVIPNERASSEEFSEIAPLREVIKQMLAVNLTVPIVAAIQLLPITNTTVMHADDGSAIMLDYEVMGVLLGNCPDRGTSGVEDALVPFRGDMKAISDRPEFVNHLPALAGPPTVIASDDHSVG